MLKKIALGSFITLMVSILVFAALCPLAIADSVSLAKKKSPEYSVQTEILRHSADKVAAVMLEGGYIDSLEVRLSPDGDIHVLTDNYRMEPIHFKPYLSDDGMLTLHFSLEGMTEFSFMTRDNITRAVMAELNNASPNRVILELPASVEYISGNRDTYRYGDLSIDERVTVFEPAPEIAEDEDAPDDEDAASDEDSDENDAEPKNAVPAEPEVSAASKTVSAPESAAVSEPVSSGSPSGRPSRTSFKFRYDF